MNIFLLLNNTIDENVSTSNINEKIKISRKEFKKSKQLLLLAYFYSIGEKK